MAKGDETRLERACTGYPTGERVGDRGSPPAMPGPGPLLQQASPLPSLKLPRSNACGHRPPLGPEGQKFIGTDHPSRTGVLRESSEDHSSQAGWEPPNLPPRPFQRLQSLNIKPQDQKHNLALDPISENHHGTAVPGAARHEPVFQAARAPLPESRVLALSTSHRCPAASLPRPSPIPQANPPKS